MTDYRRAFKIACELLNWDVLYGVSADDIYELMMKKDGVVSSSSYEEYILNHLQDLDHGQYAIKALEEEPILDKIRAEIVELTKCPYGTECLGANCPSNTDCMICGDHVLDIIDKYKAESGE